MARLRSKAKVDPALAREAIDQLARRAASSSPPRDVRP